jgi:hypothetical protein
MVSHPEDLIGPGELGAPLVGAFKGAFKPGLLGGVEAPAGVLKIKPVNLLSWRDVDIDMHVLPRHKIGGALSAGRTTFPE